MTLVPPVVPYTRKLHLGSTGRDVIAVKRALSRAGFMDWGDFTPLWGRYAVTACKNFQKAKRLKQSGEYTFATHEALRKAHRKGSKTEWAFGGLSIAMMHGADTTPEERIRYRIVDFLNWTILHRDMISYRQYRPNDPHCIPLREHWYADCSEYAKTSYLCSGAKSPDGLDWQWGSTYSFREHGRAISLDHAKIGDMVFYTRPDHVGVLRAKVKGVWYVSEHGSDAGPLNVPANYRSIVEVRTYPLV
jgi:Putative peptidoglycan binding domain